MNSIEAAGADERGPAAVPSGQTWEQQRRRVTVMLLAPPLVIMTLLFLVPIFQLVWLSLMDGGSFSLDGYAELTDPVYIKLILFTWQLAATVTLICLVIAYPIAYILANVENALSRWIVLFLIIAISLSVLARTYSWIIILQRNGILNRALIETGMIDSPLSLVYNSLGVLIGMVHILLPFMVLTLVPMLRAVNPGLVRSALSLGAHPITAFLRIYFPLSLPGVIAGCMLVFAMGIGFFVTPAILGGGRASTIAMAVQTQIEVLADLRLASATSIVLLVMTVAVLLLYEKIAGIDRIFGSGTVNDDHLLTARGRSILFAYGWVILFFIMAPVLVLIPISFSAENAFVFPPKEFSLAWYEILVENPRWSASAILSLKIAAVATICAILIGVPAAIAMSRLGANFGRFVKLLFVAPMVVPVMVIGVAFYVLFAEVGLLGSFLSISIAHTILIMPFVVIPVMARLLSLDPALERAAASLGAGPYRTIYAIIVPLLGPAIAASFIFAFLHSFDEVVMAQFLSGPRLETLPRRMWEGIAVGGLDKTITAVTTIQVAATIVLLGGIAFWRRQPKPAQVSAMHKVQSLKHPTDAEMAAPPAPRVASSAPTRKDGDMGVSITFDRLSMNYGKHGGGHAFSLEDFSLHVEPGEFLTILGPSGSGKTTVLMLIAGFISANSGRLLLGDRDISAIPPHQRNLGVVFQNYALFPHFNVRRNLAFPLEVRGMPKDEVDKRIEWALSLVHMEGFAERRITQLSGGQQQRVALARAIIFNPRALLMDEPLAALDRNLRVDMQREIRSLTRSLGQTVIYVTHDQEEALNLSDRIAVMDKGELQQVATPRDIYLKPRNSFVAGFFGEANLFNGMAHGNKLVLANGVHVPLPGTRAGNAVLCIRPEVVRTDAQPNGSTLQLQGTVIDTRFQGSILRTRVQTDIGEVVSVRQTTLVQVPPQHGSTVHVSWEPEHTHVMDN